MTVARTLGDGVGYAKRNQGPAVGSFAAVAELARSHWLTLFVFVSVCWGEQTNHETRCVSSLFQGAESVSYRLQHLHGVRPQTRVATESHTAEVARRAALAIAQSVRVVTVRVSTAVSSLYDTTCLALLHLPEVEVCLIRDGDRRHHASHHNRLGHNRLCHHRLRDVRLLSHHRLRLRDVRLRLHA